MICSLCRRERKGCEEIRLSTEEREALLRFGGVIPEVYAYCRPCMRTLRDPETANRLLRGVVEGALRRAGARDPPGGARRFVDALVAKAKPLKRKS